jgi:hypothetical protein
MTGFFQHLGQHLGIKRIDMHQMEMGLHYPNIQ